MTTAVTVGPAASNSSQSKARKKENSGASVS
jgi:hypothetical protein